MSALQKGEKILVTGATGYIGANVVTEALKAGLKVRATARDEKKAALLNDVFGKSHPGDFETVIVSDFTTPGAFDEAVKGVDGVAHIANVMTFSPNWDDVVVPSVKGGLAALESAAKEPKVRRVVLTSSSNALGLPDTEKPQHWTADTWNTTSVDDAKANPNPWNVYAASKVETEKAAWDFVKTKKPQFSLVTILPNTTWGAASPAASSTTTNGFVLAAAGGKSDYIKGVGSQSWNNVTDIARVHIKALTVEDVKNERIIAFNGLWTWRDVLAAIKKADPNAADITDVDASVLDSKDLTTADTSRYESLLGKDTLADLDTSIAQVLGKAPAHI